MEPGQPALQAIVARFGSEVLQTDGRLDRRRLRSLVLADPAARRDLEAITHPAIRARMDSLSATAGGPYQILAIPLLIESGGLHRVDRVLVVDCPEALQRRRVMARDQSSEAQARAVIAAQASREARLEAADDVILNDGDLADLGRQVETLHQRYRMAAQAQAE